VADGSLAVGSGHVDDGDGGIIEWLLEDVVELHYIVKIPFNVGNKVYFAK